MFLILTILFGIMTILLLSGKGAFLIAGYNTASKATKARYDEKKLCYVGGALTGLLTIEMLLLALFSDKMDNLASIVVIISIIAGFTAMLLMNTVCKKKDVVSSSKGKDNTKLSIILTLVITLIVIIALLILSFTGDVQVKEGSDYIKIHATYWNGKTINYKDIKSISYEKDFESGRKTNGFDSSRLLLGQFKNDTLGKYILYIYTKCDDVILLNTNNGYVAINAKTAKETKTLYKQLKEHLR